jgi:probable phosphoglycerate mutase
VAALLPAALLSSDLARAWQTAQALADAAVLPIEASPLLHERNFGDWRGRAWTDVGADPFTLQEAPPGGESMAAFEQRVAAAWAQLQARRAQLAGPLVVVTHGLLIHRLLSAHAALAPGTVLPRQLDNASLTVLDAAPPHAVTLMGCTRHLADDPNARP